MDISGMKMARHRASPIVGLDFIKSTLSKAIGPTNRSKVFMD